MGETRRVHRFLLAIGVDVLAAIVAVAGVLLFLWVVVQIADRVDPNTFFVVLVVCVALLGVVCGVIWVRDRWRESAEP